MLILFFSSERVIFISVLTNCMYLRRKPRSTGFDKQKFSAQNCSYFLTHNF